MSEWKNKRILPRSSWQNNRNKAKQFRPVRVGKDGESPQFPDVMRVYNPQTEKMVLQNTTGCYGSVSTFQPRVYVPGPKKGKVRNFKKKRTCKLFVGNASAAHERDSLAKILELRRQLLTMQAISNALNGKCLDGAMRDALDRINRWLFQTLEQHELKVIFDKDDQRFRSISGQIKSGHVTSFGYIKKLGHDIHRAMYLIDTF